MTRNDLLFEFPYLIPREAGTLNFSEHKSWSHLLFLSECQSVFLGIQEEFNTWKIPLFEKKGLGKKSFQELHLREY